jgi:hypothetical protein
MIDIYDRIKETTYTIGTGNFALSGVVQGFSSFSSVYSNSGELFYAVTDGTNYEIGSGLYLSPSNQVKRFPIRSTNSNSLVNFTEGLKEIYVNYPATNAVFSTSGLFPVPQNSGMAFWNSSSSLSYSNKFTVDSGNGRIGINKSNPTASIDVGGPSLSSNVKASGFIVGNSGVYFPSGNNGLSSYSGGVQLTHYEMNQTDLYSGSVIQLSGGVNQHILLKKQNAGTIFAGPISGCSPPCDPAYPNFRLLATEDIPNLSSLYYSLESGNILSSRINSVSGIVYAASGALNSRTTAVSGYLDNKINSAFNANTTILSQFRISTSTTDPLAEGVSQTIYLHPYIGNMISLFNGATWEVKQFSSTLALNASSVTADINYDIFAYLNGSTLSFESIVWSNDTSRSVAISLQDGVYCKFNDKTRRYLGSVRKTSSNFYNDYSRRLVFNAYNRVKRLNMNFGYFDSWSITPSLNYRVINTSLLPTIKFLYGLPEMIDANINLLVQLPGVRSSYQVILLDKAYSQEAISNGNIFLGGTEEIVYDRNNKINAIGQGFYIDGDYQDLMKTVATASMTTELTGYLELLAAERVPIGVSPTISHQSYYGAVGYNATSYQ